MSASIVTFLTASLSKVKKILATVSLLLFSLFLVLLMVLFFLTGTDKGFYFLLHNAQDISAGRFQFSKVRGNLLNQFELTDILYHDPALKLRINELHVDWQFEDLLNKKITLNTLQATGIYITRLLATKKEENVSVPEIPIQLPEINPAIGLFLKQVQLTDIHFMSELDTEATRIEKIHLSAELINSRLKLLQFFFSISQPQGSIQGHISGFAELINDYPMSLQSSIALDISEQDFLPPSKLNISSEITGDLSQLQINQHSSGLLNASIKTRIKHLLGKIDWQTDILAEKLPLELFNPENNQILKDKFIDAQISATGDLNQAHAEIKTHLSSTPQSSQLAIKGDLSWQSAIKWQAKLHTEKLNPGLFHPDWPGALTIDLHTKGHFSADKFSANIQLDKLTGQLRQKPLSGSGQFHLDNNKLSIQQFSLSSGDALIKANGQLGNTTDRLDLNWSVASKQLSDLLPDVQGQINGQGNIAGTMQQPVIAAQLQLTDISYQARHLKQADLRLELNSNPALPSNIEINAQSLSIDSQELKQFKLSLNGSLNNHQINLSAQHELASIALAAKGQFDIKQLNWSGQIKPVHIDSRDWGQWQQQTAATVFGSTDKVSLSSLCLEEVSDRAQNAMLCAQIDWNPEQGHARLDLKTFSLARVKPYLPEEVSKLSGELNIMADIDLEPLLEARLKAEITPGELILQTLAQQPIKLKHRNGLIIADYNKQQLETHWNIEVDSHSIDGQINIPRSGLEKDPLTAPAKGRIKIDIKDLNILSILLPRINNASGKLSAQLDLGGMLGSPIVTGHAKLSADYLSIDDAGIRIEDINIDIQDKNNGRALAVLGGGRSGNGQLDLNGSITLDAAQGWPVTINLKGDNFLAINTPDIYAVISPDIQFHQQQGLMHFKGRIVVPEATISPTTIPKGSIGVSPDVEVLGREKETPANLDLNITLALGADDIPDTPEKKISKAVKLDAFGLKTGLSGELSIDQRPRQLITARGELHLNDGTFRAYGQDLTIDQGSIFYAGGYIDNPGIKLTASRQIADSKVGIKVSGSAKKPDIRSFSDNSSLKSKDIISMILTGQKFDNLNNARIYAGTELGDDLSVGVNAGMGDDGSEFVTRYKLTDKIQLEGTSSSTKSGANIIYTFEVE